MRKKSEINLSAGEYLQRKKERYEMVKQGKWRAKKGKILDLYDINEVPNEYLETMILSSAQREKIDRQGYDAKIMEILLEIRKQRKNKMNSQQIEMNDIISVAETAATIKPKKVRGNTPRLFNVGDIVGNVEILSFEKKNIGSLGGWSYKVRNTKTGKDYKVKQSSIAKCKILKRAEESETNPWFSEEKNLSAKTETRPSVNINNKNQKDKRVGRSIIKESFPRIRCIKSKYGDKFVCDHTNGPNGYKGKVEWFTSLDAAYAKANEIENVLSNINIDKEIKKLSFVQRLKRLFL